MLIKSIDYAMSVGRKKELRDTIDVVRDEHLKAVELLRKENGKAGYNGLFEKVAGDIVGECDKLRGFLSAAQVRLFPHRRNICR